jgi:hypothetical protein
MSNGNTTPNPNLNLPPPVAEQLPVVPVSTPETASKQAEKQSVAAAETAPAPMPTSIPAVSNPTPVNLQQSDASSTTISTPTIADDNDLIEKEWVLKAKEIVAKTRNDPYKQNKDMNVVKADYMQKRYNKTIKLSE